MSNELEIQHLIAHNVDHRSLDAPELSEREPPSDPQVAAFFAHHIQEARKHQHSQESVFTDAGSDLQALCRNILRNPKRNLVKASQEIAQLLFASMLRNPPVADPDEDKLTNLKPDRRISSGELVVCTFTNGDEDPWLALLKMDSAQGFASESTIIDGQFVIVFKPVGGVMPTGELQKCAFVLPEKKGKTSRIDLLVLDQQVTPYGGHRLASSFFTERFLRCEPVLNAADRNRAFIAGSQLFAENSDWSDEQRNEFQDGLEQVTKQPRINVVHFSDTFVPTGQQDEYLDFLRSKQGLSQFVFRRDPDVTEKLTRYLEFRGDAGLKVLVESHQADQILNAVQDPATGEWTVTIRTAQWKKRFKSRK